MDEQNFMEAGREVQKEKSGKVQHNYEWNHGRVKDIRGELELEAPELRVSPVKGQEMQLKW